LYLPIEKSSPIPEKPKGIVKSVQSPKSSKSFPSPKSQSPPLNTQFIAVTLAPASIP